MKFRSLINKYQDYFWYSGQAINEARRPLQLWNEALLLVTFLAVKGYDLSFLEVAIAYVGIMISTVVVGMILTRLGIISYITELGNRQNPQLLNILETVKRLEQKIDEQNMQNKN